MKRVNFFLAAKVELSRLPPGLQDEHLLAGEQSPVWDMAHRQDERCRRIVDNILIDNDEFAETVLGAARLGHPDALNWLAMMGIEAQMELDQSA